MRVIKRLPLVQFGNHFPAAIEPLDFWYRATRIAKWQTFAGVRSTFGQTDQVKVASGATVCVFDIGGNKFRLVAFISYAKGKVYVLRIMTHKEYDTNKWKKEL